MEWMLWTGFLTWSDIVWGLTASTHVDGDTTLKPALQRMEAAWDGIENSACLRKLGPNA